MLIGIQVALKIALQSWTCWGAVSAVTSAGGLIMYVSQPLAMNMTIVPQTLSRTPRPRWPYFAFPSLQRSHP